MSLNNLMQTTAGATAPRRLPPARPVAGEAPELTGPSRASTVDRLSDSSITPAERDTLFREFAPLVKRLLNQYGTDRESRRDLIGEIYWRFCRIVDAFDHNRGVPFRAYVVRQLTAATHTHARTRWRRSGREIALDLNSTLPSWEPAFDPTPQWTHDLVEAEARRFIPDAMSRLPNRQRQVLVWRFYEDRSYEEIAAMLGVQPATVRSLLRHGVAKLRSWVQENGVTLD